MAAKGRWELAHPPPGGPVGWPPCSEAQTQGEPSAATRRRRATTLTPECRRRVWHTRFKSDYMLVVRIEHTHGDRKVTLDRAKTPGFGKRLPAKRCTGSPSGRRCPWRSREGPVAGPHGRRLGALADHRRRDEPGGHGTRVKVTLSSCRWPGKSLSVSSAFTLSTVAPRRGPRRGCGVRGAGRHPDATRGSVPESADILRREMQAKSFRKQNKCVIRLLQQD